MSLKKIAALGSVLALALCSLSVLASTSKVQAAGVTLYWCEYGSNSNFNTASNWNTASNCSSTEEVPVSGDSLVFDNSPLSSTLDITNNISDLDISSITFQGNGSGSYDLTGDTIDLDNGITDSGSGAVTNYVDLPIDLTANQSFIVTANDNLQILDSVSLGSNNLTIGAGVSKIEGTLSGSGGLTFASPASAVADYELYDADTSLSGPITIDQNAAVVDNSGSLNALGSGTITINSGGSLTLNSSASSATLTNSLNLSGNGDGSSHYGAIISCLSQSTDCTTANTDLTLSGNVSLNGNSEVVNGAYSGSSPISSAEFNFTGNVSYNGHTLTGVSGSNTIVNLPPVKSTSGGGGGSSKTVGPPDTGYGQSSSNYGFLIASILIASSLVIGIAVLNKAR